MKQTKPILKRLIMHCMACGGYLVCTHGDYVCPYLEKIIEELEKDNGAPSV